MDQQESIKLITLDPGHFHASLLQKSMYPQMDKQVYVYAAEGPELEDHLNRVGQFNTRANDPAYWRSVVYSGSDYLEKMLLDKPGNMVVIAGNNAKKTDYIHSAVLAGINVLADKPMVIHPQKYPLLREAFRIAEQKGLLIYDIMTEQFEITTILQRELAGIPEVFGEMEKGSVEYPAVSKESVHHFYKEVAGKPLQRPAWFFDIEQQGAGIVDVSNHLVDLILWECFPGQSVHQEEVEVVHARQWATEITSDQFEKATGLSDHPHYLKNYLDCASVLSVLSNGEFIFSVKNIYCRVSVIWNFEAPEGAGDTHYSMIKGSRANLVIRQGPEQLYKPALIVEPVGGIHTTYEAGLKEAVSRLAIKYQGISMKPIPAGWEIIIPEKNRTGHEAHFSQVTEKFLHYMKEGQLPAWEKANMLTRYFIIMEAYRKSLI